MATQVLTHDKCEQIRREHAELCELVTTLYRVLAERHEPAPRVAHLMENLLERVNAHFQDEEATGLFEDLDRQAPHEAGAIQELLREHEELRDRLTKLNQRAADGNLTPECWDELEFGFRDFSTLMCHHEARENKLLQDAYERDLGNKD
jgi:iron-sulfur cluster repair protein YtfE (RIC family)